MTEVGNVELLVSLNTKALPQQVAAVQQQLAGKDANIKLGVLGASEAANSIQRVDQSLQLAQKSAGGFFETATGFVKATQEAALFAQGMQVVSNQLGAAAGQVKAFTDRGLEAFKEYDKAIGTIRTLPGIDSGQVEADAKNLTDEFKNQVTTTQLLKSSYDVLSAGFTKSSDAINVNRSAIVLSKGGFTELGTATNALTAILNSYNLGTEKANTITDQLVQTQNLGKLRVSEFAGQIGAIAPAAAALNIPFNQIGGALATITNTGVPAAQAVTQTVDVIQSLSKATPDAILAAKNYNIELGETALRTKGLTGFVKELAEKNITQLSSLSELTGGNELAAQGLLKLVQNQQKFLANSESVKNSQGAGAAAAKQVAQEFGERLTQAINKANEAFVSLGAGVAKSLSPLVDAAGFTLDAFNKLPEPIKEVTGVAIAGVGGFLLVSKTITGVAAASAVAKAGFDFLATSTAKATTLTEANAIAQFTDIEALTADTAATEVNAVAKATAGEAALAFAGKLGGLATGLGSLAIQGGLTAAAIGSVTLAAATFADGGKEFNDSAKKIEDDIKAIGDEADKTAGKLKNVKPPSPDGDPNRAKASNPLEQASAILTRGRIEFGPNGPELKTDGKGTDLAEKEANDKTVGLGNFSVAANTAISDAQTTAQAFKLNPKAKSINAEQLKATRKALDDTISETDANIGKLDRGALGEERFKAAKEGLELTKNQALAAKDALDKYVPAVDGAAGSTGKAGDAAKGFGEKIKDAQAELKKLQADNQLRDANFANQKQDAVTNIKKTQRTFGADEDRDIQQQTNAAEIVSNNAQIASTEESLARVRELKKAGGVAAVEATQQESQLIQKLSGLRASAAEKEVSQRRLANQKILADVELRDKQEEAAINRRASVAKLASAPGQVETNRIDEIQTQQTIALKQKELAETQKLKQQGILGSREAAEKELAIAAALDNERLKLLETRRARERADVEQRDKLAEASIARQVSAATLAVRSQQLSGGGLTGEGGQAEIQRIQEVATQQTIVQKQRELAEVNQLEARKVIGVREAENQKLSILQAIDQARSQLLDQQTQRELRAIQNVADAQKRQYQEASAGIDRQKAGNDLLLGSLQRQSQLVEAQAKVSAAVAEARQQQLKAAVDRAGEAVEDAKKLQDKNLGANQRQVLQAQVGQLAGGVNPNDAIALVRNKQAAETEADREKLAALKEQQAAERKTEELKLRQAEVTARNNILEAERANITAKIAENEQKANLLKALKTGDANEIENAKQGLALASQNVAITGAQIGNAQANAATQSQVGSLELQALGIKQNTALQAQQEQNSTAGRGRALELAQTADQAGVRIGIDPNGGASPVGGGVSYNAGQTTNAGQTFGGNGFEQAIAPSKVPTANPTQVAAQQGFNGGNLTQLGNTLAGAIDRLGQRLAASMSRPNVTAITASPVTDAAKLMADSSKQQLGQAGL